MLTTDRLPLPLGTLAPSASAAGTRVAMELLVLLFALPFLWAMHHQPASSFDAEWLSGVILCALAFSVPFSVRAGPQLQWPLPAWLAAMALAGALQLALGWIPYPGECIGLAVHLFALFIAYAIGRWIVASGLRAQAIASIATALAFAGAASVLLQWFQSFGVSRFPDWFMEYLGSQGSGRPSANTGQPNLLATLLALGLLASMFLYGPRRRAWRLLLLAWISFGLAWTGSRLALAYVPLLAVVCFVPTGLRAALRKDRVLICAAIVAGFALGSVLEPKSIQQRFRAAAAAIEEARTAPAAPASSHGAAGQGISLDPAWERQGGTLSIRRKMWGDALVIASNHPLLGVGNAQYAKAQFLEAPAGDLLIATTNAHNVVLHLAAEMGWPLALALVGYGLWWARGQWRRDAAEPGLDFVAFGVMIIVLHGMVEWPLWLLHVAAPTVLLLALAEPERVAARRLHVAAVAALGAVGIMAAVLLRVDFERMSDSWARTVVAYRQKTQQIRYDPQVIQSLSAIPRFSPFRPFADLILLIQLTQSGRSDPGMLELSHRVMSWRTQVLACTRYIVLLAQAGQIDEAARLAGRLGAFEWDDLDTRETHRWILAELQRIGPAGEPVRAAFLKASARTLHEG